MYIKHVDILFSAAVCGHDPPNATVCCCAMWSLLNFRIFAYLLYSPICSKGKESLTLVLVWFGLVLINLSLGGVVAASFKVKFKDSFLSADSPKCSRIAKRRINEWLSLWHSGFSALPRDDPLMFHSAGRQDNWAINTWASVCVFTAENVPAFD